jgi:hypothetical protein
VFRKRGFEDRKLLVVPSSMQEELIRGAHASRFAGHGAALKTITRLQQKWYWPGMTSQVTSFIEKCLICSKCKGKVGKAPLHPIELPELPNQRVHMDLCGPWKGSAVGNKYVLAITDAFTKYAVMVAIPNKEAVTVAKAVFDHWVCKFSVPKTLVSDRGREFDNQIMDELCLLLGVNKRLSSVMHPQSNTAVESWNRSLIKFLTTALSGSSTLDWEVWLPVLALSYNTAVHKSTLQSPFYLTYLHHPNMPYFDMDEPTSSDPKSWATEAYLRMMSAYRLARSNNEEALLIGKEYYDRSATKEKEFQVGDHVLVFFPKAMNKDNHKISEPWRDGYRVLERTGPVSYVVQRGPHARPHAAQVNRLKMAPDGSTPLPPPVARPILKVQVHRERKRLTSITLESDDDLLPDPGPIQPAPLPVLAPPVLPQGARENEDPDNIQHIPEGPAVRLARDIFQRVTRAHGPVPEEPHVQPRILERRRRE